MSNQCVHIYPTLADSKGKDQGIRALCLLAIMSASSPIHTNQDNSSSSSGYEDHDNNNSSNSCYC